VFGDGIIVNHKDHAVQGLYGLPGGKEVPLTGQLRRRRPDPTGLHQVRLEPSAPFFQAWSSEIPHILFRTYVTHTHGAVIAPCRRFCLSIPLMASTILRRLRCQSPS